jgi:hypothetical protein
VLDVFRPPEHPLAIRQHYQTSGLLISQQPPLRRLATVIAVGKIDLARRAHSAGGLAISFIGRGLMADPELPNKVGRQVRWDPTLHLPQSPGDRRLPATCTVNLPGQRAEYKLEPAATERRLVIGGPAGLSAAFTTAEEVMILCLWKTDKLRAVESSTVPSVKKFTD